MTLIFIRHDRVKADGLCYGQLDISPTIHVEVTAQKLRPRLPTRPDQVISSPLIRCAHLANQLFPAFTVELDDQIQEVHFGDWEGKPWSSIDRKLIDLWAETPTDFQFPNGEYLADFSHRIQQWLSNLIQSAPETVVIVTHAGVIRLCYALLLNTTWIHELERPIGYSSIHTFKNRPNDQLWIADSLEF